MGKSRKRYTFYYLLTKFPPCLCRLLARHKSQGPMSVKEISERSGLPIFEVIELSRLRDWDSVKVSTVRQFTHGCGIDLDDPISVKRKLVYMAGYKKGDKRMPPRFRYLRRSESWDSFYKPLIMEWTNDAR